MKLKINVAMSPVENTDHVIHLQASASATNAGAEKNVILKTFVATTIVMEMVSVIHQLVSATVLIVTKDKIVLI